MPVLFVHVLPHAVDVAAGQFDGELQELVRVLQGADRRVKPGEKVQKKKGEKEEFYQELLRELFLLVLAGAGWQSGLHQIFQVFFQLLMESELSFGASGGENHDGRSQTLSE